MTLNFNMVTSKVSLLFLGILFDSQQGVMSVLKIISIANGQEDLEASPTGAYCTASGGSHEIHLRANIVFLTFRGLDFVFDKKITKTTIEWTARRNSLGNDSEVIVNITFVEKNRVTTSNCTYPTRFWSRKNVVWSGIEVFYGEVKYQSPDITELLLANFNSTLWNDERALQLAISPQMPYNVPPGHHRAAYTHNKNAQKGPKLRIEFEDVPFSEWSDWLECLADNGECGQGMKIRTKIKIGVINEQGEIVNRTIEENSTCIISCIPDIGVWSTWIVTEPCKACGTSRKVEIRECESQFYNINATVCSGEGERIEPCFASSPCSDSLQGNQLSSLQCGTSIEWKGFAITDHHYVSFQVADSFECCKHCALIGGKCKSYALRIDSSMRKYCVFYTITHEESYDGNYFTHDSSYSHYTDKP